MSIPSGSSNPMKICLGVLRKIEIDNYVDRLNVNPTSKKIGTHKISADAVSEIVEDTIPILLEHLGMGVKARVAEFSDLLSKKFHTVRRIAKDDRLVDLELGKECVEAVYLLLLFHEAVVLGDSTEGELVHKIDLIRIFHVFILFQVRKVVNLRNRRTNLE